jgi:hypothetical protein
MPIWRPLLSEKIRKRVAIMYAGHGCSETQIEE